MPENNSVTTSNSESARQSAAVQHLIAVHDYFRAYLKQIKENVDKFEFDPPAPDGPPAPAAARLKDLQAHCMYFCSGLAGHHNKEDSMFPALRQNDPEMGPVIDRLEQEHRQVAVYLERIGQIVESLPSANEETLAALRKEFGALSNDLLAHLSYEEEALAPVLARTG